MKGYIIDTNILDAAINSDSPVHSITIERLRGIAMDLVFVSAITLGEMEYGIAVAPSFKDAELAEFRRRVKTDFPHTLSVSPTTAEAYGELRKRLFEKYSPTPLRQKKRRVDQLTDPTTGLNLGIDENDLWLAAQAYENSMTLVTLDKMRHIKEVAATDVGIECWLS